VAAWNAETALTSVDADWEVVTMEQPPSIDSAAFYKVDVSLP
jgi:hypothetical protein